MWVRHKSDLRWLNRLFQIWWQLPQKLDHLWSSAKSQELPAGWPKPQHPQQWGVNPWTVLETIVKRTVSPRCIEVTMVACLLSCEETSCCILHELQTLQQPLVSAGVRWITVVQPRGYDSLDTFSQIFGFNPFTGRKKRAELWRQRKWGKKSSHTLNIRNKEALFLFFNWAIF